MTHPDILIVGGGVIGVCAAYYLAADGHTVTLVEKGEIASGSSYGNAGLLVPSHAIPLAAPGVWRQGLKWLLDPESPLYIQPRLDMELLRWLWRFGLACRDDRMRSAIPVLASLGRASLELYAELAAIENLKFGFEQHGGVFLFDTQAGFEHGNAEARLLNEFGVKSEVLDAEGARRLVAGLGPSIFGGIYYPLDAHLIPDRFVRKLARLVESQGVHIKTSTEVLGFEVSNSRIVAVITSQGRFTPGQVVLAAGAWSPVIARDLDIRLCIQAAKGYSVTVKRPSTGPGIPLHLSESKVVVTPMGEALRFAGTLELAGLQLTVNQRRVTAIRRAVTRYLPHLTNLVEIEVWCGLRPLAPDTLPIIGRSQRVSNLIFATGHGMLGMSLGPITGRLVAQVAARAIPSIDLSPLRAERLA